MYIIRSNFEEQSNSELNIAKKEFVWVHEVNIKIFKNWFYAYTIVKIFSQEAIYKYIPFLQIYRNLIRCVVYQY